MTERSDKTIGILYICTGKYSIFWKDFYLSCEKYFIPNIRKEYFVFTDAAEIEFSSSSRHIHVFHQKNLGWPQNTLMRYEIFLSQQQDIAKTDYVFFFNANTLFMREISDADFLPAPAAGEALVAARHPYYYKKKNDKFPYERRENSRAYIPYGIGQQYVQGSINGGLSEHFLAAAKVMNENIVADQALGLVALWHDESHWNKYVLSRNDVKILPPSYVYPEGSFFFFRKIIMLRNKAKYGGHTFLRADGV